MRRPVGPSAAGGRPLVVELSPAGAVPAATLGLGLPLSDKGDPEAQLGSPTARKLQQRRSASAAVRAGTAGLRLRVAAAAAAVLLLILLGRAVTHGSAGKPHRGFPGGDWRQKPSRHTADAGGKGGSTLDDALSAGPAGQPTFVEFMVPGVFVPLAQALDAAIPESPQEATLLAALPHGPPASPEQLAFAGRPSLEAVLRERQSRAEEAVAARDGSHAADRALGERSGDSSAGSADARRSSGGASAAELANMIQAELQHQAAAAAKSRRVERQLLVEQHPKQEVAGVRMLVAVASACCSAAAAKRRAAVRDTWARDVAEHPAVDLRFFLAQPATPELAETWLPRLQAELAAHNDSVVLRGADSYRNLPNKTLRLMRFALAHPAGYTHVLKTDDDCYVRLPAVLEALRQQHGEEGKAEMPSSAGSTATTAAAAAAGRPSLRLPGLNGALRAQVAREGSPLHSDGIQLYNVSRLVASAGAAADRVLLDDAEGRPVSLAQLASEAQLRQAPAGMAGGVHLAQQAGPAAAAGLVHASAPRPRMAGVYMGCLENQGGFFPIREPSSKWYTPEADLPDSAVPFAVRYLAGWGYVLSRDLANHAVRKANLFLRHPEAAPAWFRPLAWEDVLMGLLLMDAARPHDHPGFRAAWRACPASTAVKHLDVDAPALLRGLREQELSGLWTTKPVQCSSADALPGDWASWKAWRDGLPSVKHI